MIRFVCECGKQLQARDDNAGKLDVCPVCQRQVKVPAESPPPEAVQADLPVVVEEPELEEERITERPRRRSQPAGSSGKAIASLILGILSLFCNVLAGVPALLLGMLALRDIGRSRGSLSGHGLAIAGIVTACACTLLSCVLLPLFLLPAMLLPAVQKVREAATRVESMNNLKQLVLALHNYNDTYQTVPPAAVGDPSKPPPQRRPLLSWRVAILPMIGEQALYNQFKLDEPWDGPHNIRLLPQMPKTFQLPGDDKTPPDHTHYQVFVGKGAAFDKTRGHNIPIDFPDGMSNTIFIVEAANAVPWTKPQDVDFDPAKPMLPLMSTHFRGGFHVALGDGFVRMVGPQVSENTFKAAITRNGRDALGPDWREH